LNLALGLVLALGISQYAFAGSTLAASLIDQQDEVTHYGNTVEFEKVLSSNVKQLPQAIGRHDGGRLINAVELPKMGEGFIRHRDVTNVWGTTLLIGFVQWFTKVLKDLRPQRPPLEIAELSQKNGGAFTDNGHLSHQNGLDVDIGFPTLTSHAGEKFPRFIENGKINPDIDLERLWLGLKILGAQDQVILVYVDGRVKKAICAYAKKTNDYSDKIESYSYNALLKLRPWGGHNNHFHLRLQCPHDSPKCQVAIPVDVRRGTGC
jgi:penicillin-insensitive murein endopeptidase